MAPDRRASPADEAARSPSDYQEHQVPRGPYRLWAREYPGVEPTLELLHGFPDNLHLYDRLLPQLHPPRRVITGVLTWDEERGDGGLLVLLPGGQATDRSRAIGFLQEAVADARAIGRILVCEGFQALQAALAGAMVPAGPAAAEVAAMAEAANNLFRRDGQYWTVVFDGAVARLKHTKGLGHLARLLAQPGREFHTLDLEAADGQPAPPGARAGRGERELEVRRDLGDAGVLLDATAKAAYQARLEELQAELEEAEDHNDPTRAAMARQELDVLVGELARAVGLGGRDRRAASHAERARLNATRAIRAAMAKLAEVNPALGRHLAATVRTGRYCCYTPDPRVPITWKLTRDEPCSTKPAGMTPQHPEAANQQPRRPAMGPPADVRERRNNGSPALNVPTVRTRSLGACPAAPLPERRPDMEAPVVLHLAAGKPDGHAAFRRDRHRTDDAR
jgi:hypothetical protein